MDITRFAIEKRRITTTVLLLILIAGLVVYRKMPRDEDPGFIIRTAFVSAYLPGASPERIEELVTDKLEMAIQEMPEIDYIKSISKTGASLIYVNIKESYKNMRPIWDDLRRKVMSAKGLLPEGIVGPFVNDEFGDIFGIIISITGEGYSYAELKNVADDVRDELLMLNDVAKVDIYGKQEERIFVEYNNARLAKFGISPLQIKQILQKRNIIIPGGDILTNKERIVLEPTGNFESIEDLRKTVIKLPKRDELIFLENLANVYRGYVNPPKMKMFLSGIPCLGIAINMREGGDIIRMGKEVKSTVKRLQGVYPIGIEFDFVAFQPYHVEKKVNDFVQNLIEAIVLVILIMLIFLGLRTGLLVSTLVPMAMIMSILVMSFFHIGIDQMSLASLIIALGMLVDNGIFMAESIMVKMGRGMKATKAAIDSTHELCIPMLTSSLTTAAAFLPIFLAESSTGEYTAPLFKVVTITLLSSWVLSLTMIPFLCVLFMRIKATSKENSFDSKYYKGYRNFLIGLLKHPIAALLAVFILFVVSMQGFRYIPKMFFPPNDKAIFTAEVELPIGTSIEYTEKVVRKIEKFMKDSLIAREPDVEGIVNWATFIGQGAPRFTLAYSPKQFAPEYAFMLINATSQKIIKDKLMPQMESFLLENFPDVVPKLQLVLLGPPIDAPIEIRISGKDTDKIFSIVEKIKEKLDSINGTKNIKDNWGQRTKKLVVNVNQPRARRAGITSWDVAMSLQTVLTGIEITQFREDNDIIPIVLRTVADERLDIDKLDGHNIYAQQTNRSVPLKQIADIDIIFQPAQIKRRNRLKTVTVQADVLSNASPIAISNMLDEWLKEKRENWPVGYRYELGGEVEASGKANKSIADKLGIAVLIILLLLVFQFDSMRKTIIIAITIPLELIGVVIGLLITRSYFGFMTILGVVSLAGIVVNNAIILLDRINIEIKTNGLIPQNAVLESAQRCLRPILITTATTISGLIPLWFFGGPMWEPLAIAIIFGLAFSTLLTLFVVPVLYSILFRVKFD